MRSSSDFPLNSSHSPLMAVPRFSAFCCSASIRSCGRTSVCSCSASARVASSVASFFSSSGSGGGGDGTFSFPVASRTFAEGAAVRLEARLLGAMCDFEQNSKNEPIFQF